MPIYIKLLNNEAITLEVEAYHTIEYVKTQIQSKKGIPSDQQILKYHGKVLENGCNLSNYNVSKYSTLYLLMEPGGLKG